MAVSDNFILSGNPNKQNFNIRTAIACPNAGTVCASFFRKSSTYLKPFEEYKKLEEQIESYSNSIIKLNPKTENKMLKKI